MDAANLVSLSALSHLQPRPGGRWTVDEQTDQGTSFTYVTGDNLQKVSYLILPCTKGDDVEALCDTLLYKFNDHTDHEEQKKDMESEFSTEKASRSIPMSGLGHGPSPIPPHLSYSTVTSFPRTELSGTNSLATTDETSFASSFYSMDSQHQHCLSAHTGTSPAGYALSAQIADGFAPSLGANKVSSELDQAFSGWIMEEQILDMGFEMANSTVPSEGLDYLASPDTWFTQMFGHSVL